MSIKPVLRTRPGRLRTVMLLLGVCFPSLLCADGLLDNLPEDPIYAPRFGLHHETENYGFDDPWTDYRAFIPLPLFDDEYRLLAFDGRFIDDNHGRLGFNVGAVYRGYLDRIDAVFGFNVYADQRSTDRFRFNQIGFGWELLGNRLEARQNFYIPSGQDRKLLGTAINSGGLIGFEGNFLMVGRDYFYEQALRGFDIEIGGALPGTDGFLGTSRPMRGYIGSYYYHNPGGTHVEGISGRINFQHDHIFDLNLFLAHDNVYDTHVGVGVTVFLDALHPGGVWSNVDRSLYRRMMDVVQRKQNITVDRVNRVNVAEPLLNSETGDPFRFVHVNNDGNSDGTFENPLTDVGQVFAYSQPGDIIYLHSGTTFDGQDSLVLQNGQRLLGEGIPHLISSVQLGVIDIPAVNGGNVLPILSNSLADAVVMADDNEISGLTILTPQGHGIFGDGLTVFNINRNEISGASGNGLHLAGINGTGTLESNLINGNAGSNAVLAGTSLSGDILDNEFNDSANGSGLDATLDQFAGTVSGNSANGNAQNGILWNGSSFTGDFLNNTTDDNGASGTLFNLLGEFTGEFSGNNANANHVNSFFTVGAGFDLTFGGFIGAFEFNTADGNGDSLLQQTRGINFITSNFQGSFRGNQANNNGGGVLSIDAGINFSTDAFEGAFEQNTTSGNFGNGTILTVTSVLPGSSFAGNVSNGNANNGFLVNIGAFDGAFDENTANGNTLSGINWNGASFNGSFRGNTTNNSNGILLANSSGVRMTLDSFTGDFSDNTADGNAAGAFGSASGFDLDIAEFNGNFSGNSAVGNANNGVNWNGNLFSGTFDNNTASQNGSSNALTNNSGFFITLDSFAGTFTNNTANGNFNTAGLSAAHGFDLNIAQFGTLADPILFAGNTANGNTAGGLLSTSNGFDLSGTSFVGLIDDNTANGNSTGNGMAIDYNTLVARITNNRFHGNGDSGNEAGLFINANDNGTTSTVLIENNVFGVTGNANRVALNVDVATGATLNLTVQDNEFVSSQATSVRINSANNLFGPDGNVNLNLFDNNASGTYALLRAGGATFNVGYPGAVPEASVAAQVTANGNTTNGGAPTVTASGGINFIMSNTIPLPPVFP